MTMWLGRQHCVSHPAFSATELKLSTRPVSFIQTYKLLKSYQPHSSPSCSQRSKPLLSVFSWIQALYFRYTFLKHNMIIYELYFIHAFDYLPSELTLVSFVWCVISCIIIEDNTAAVFRL
ncbi:hypothetical protein RSOLAG1IB_12668 [Rhizoctonia solani AG-1 IB]|uniref:Uncharacterized protein n=1 Tax=Thanatephorus cucumeris (strain AG1-IB / isolate 7/3/14) TaxID=1108050 RepID=A0A0B7FZT7_THACB|nr:hypothetical protein RSOLAG1IB_12668 [Rhizoctonia solani AG-1 IB]